MATLLVRYFLRHIIRSIPFIPATITLAVYVYTLAPGLTFDDSGELISAAYHLGIPHPPGFPFWTIIAHVFTYIPLNNIAWRVNLLSAVSSSLMAACISLIFFRVVSITHATKRQGILVAVTGISAAVIFGFIKTVWSQSVVSEVYTLTLLLISLQVLSLFRWRHTNNYLFLYLASFLYGLSIATHYIVLVLAPAYGIWALYTDKTLLYRFKEIFFALAAFSIGCLVFVYVPLRATPEQPVNWGHISTIQDSIDHIKRKQFTTPSFSPSPQQPDNAFVKKILYAPAYMVVVISRVYTPLVTIVGIAGIILLFMRTRNTTHHQYSWLLVAMFASSSIVFDGIFMPLPFTTHDTGTSFIEHSIQFLIFSIWIGYGLYVISSWLMRIHTWAIVPAIIMVASPPLYFLVTNYPLYSMRGNTVAYDHAVNILTNVDEHATIFVDKNNWLFPLLYLKTVENIRPDVTLYDRTGNLFDDIYKLSETHVSSMEALESHRKKIEEDIIAANPDTPFYFAADKNFDNEGRDVSQEGILYKAKNKSAKHIDFYETYGTMMNRENMWHDQNTSYILAYYRFRLTDKLLGEDKTDEAVAVLDSVPSISSDSFLTLTQLGTYYGMVNQFDKAISVYKQAVSLNPNAIVARRNLARVYALQGNYEQAIEAYMHARKLDPNNMSLADQIVTIASKNSDCGQAEKTVMSMDMGYPGIHILLNNTGVCWAQQQKYDKARIMWEKALDINPSYQNATDNLDMLPRTEQTP